MITREKPIIPKSTWLLFGSIICLALIFMLTRTGCEPDNSQADQAKRTIDSLQAVLQVERRAWDLRDSAYQAASQRQDARIDSQAKAIAAARDQAAKSAKNAQKWALAYDSAKSALDTSLQLLACDSLRAGFDQLQAGYQAAIAAGDSLISTQAARIATQDTMIRDQRRQIMLERNRADLAISQFSTMAKENDRLRKKQKRSGWKPAAAAVLGFILGSIK